MAMAMELAMTRTSCRGLSTTTRLRRTRRRLHSGRPSRRGGHGTWYSVPEAFLPCSNEFSL